MVKYVKSLYDPFYKMICFPEFLDNNDVDELIERQEDEILGELEEDHENQVTEIRDQVILGETSVNDVIIPQNKENTNSVTEFLKKNNLTMKKDINWKRNVTYLTPPITWYKKNVENHVTLESPLYFFKKYFTDELFEDMTKYTNLYATQKHSKFKSTTTEELQNFVGIHIMMGNLHYPRVRFYWDSNLRIPLIADCMALNRFFKLRMHVHFVNVEEKDPQNNDRFWKVRPLFDAIKQRCSSLPLESELCVDEQMVPFKGSLNVKQYLKNKPSPWGIKIFALCGKSGILYAFIIYQGSTTELDEMEKKVFGLGGAVVAKLSTRINVQNVQLYFDNYFSNYNLLQFLRHKYIYVTCTARKDRFKQPPFTSDKAMQRGSMEEIISEDGEVIMTKWYDNKPLFMASNFMGSGKVDNCRRWNKIIKEYVMVPRPEVIKTYNLCMGGVDKLDCMISIHRTFIRSRKWTLRMFTHAIDMACTNAWFEYRQKAQEMGIPSKEILDLIHFRSHVAEALILCNTQSRKRGRPSNASISSPIPKKRKYRETRPIDDVRFDNTGHFPLHENKQSASRCKLLGCKGTSRIFCEKCKVHLCLTKQKNCFVAFHKKN